MTFSRRLLAWYDRAKRDLPWRSEPSAYRTLVSELMLQQTVVATVIPFFQRFCARFPSIEALAAAKEDEVLEAWSGLGYYRRARHLHAAARVVVERHGALIPRDEALLRTLPGVGPYTAAAIAAIAYGERAFALDGNAGRVMARLSGERETPQSPAARARLHAFGLARVPAARAGDFAQAVMELGATVCTPTSPGCETCPVRTGCVALAEGRVAEIPVPPVRREPPKVPAVCLRIEDREGRVWLERRGSGLLAGTLALPMEFPPDGETGAAAARRFWRGLGGRGPLTHLGAIRHVFTHRDVTADIFRAAWEPGLPVESQSENEPSGSPSGRWCDPARRETWGGGVSTFARKTLGLAEGKRAEVEARRTRKTRQLSLVGT